MTQFDSHDYSNSAVHTADEVTRSGRLGGPGGGSRTPRKLAGLSAIALLSTVNYFGTGKRRAYRTIPKSTGWIDTVFDVTGSERRGSLHTR
jgi:hypothetical protein